MRICRDTAIFVVFEFLESCEPLFDALGFLFFWKVHNMPRHTGVRESVNKSAASAAYLASESHTEQDLHHSQAEQDLHLTLTSAVSLKLSWEHQIIKMIETCYKNITRT